MAVCHDSLWSSERPRSSVAIPNAPARHAAHRCTLLTTGGGATFIDLLSGSCPRNSAMANVNRANASFVTPCSGLSARTCNRDSRRLAASRLLFNFGGGSAFGIPSDRQIGSGIIAASGRRSAGARARVRKGVNRTLPLRFRHSMPRGMRKRASSRVCRLRYARRKRQRGRFYDARGTREKRDEVSFFSLVVARESRRRGNRLAIRKPKSPAHQRRLSTRANVHRRVCSFIEIRLIGEAEHPSTVCDVSTLFTPITRAIRMTRLERLSRGRVLDSGRARDFRESND